MKAITKNEALELYRRDPTRLRTLFAIEGREARSHFVSGNALFNALKAATHIERVFVVWDSNSFGVYEDVNE